MANNEEQYLNLDCPPEEIFTSATPSDGISEFDISRDFDVSATRIVQKAKIINSELIAPGMGFTVESGLELSTNIDELEQTFSDLSDSPQPAIETNVGIFGHWPSFTRNLGDYNPAQTPVSDTSVVEDKLRFRSRKCWAYFNEDLRPLEEYAELHNIPKVFDVEKIAVSSPRDSFGFPNLVSRYTKTEVFRITPDRDNFEMFFGEYDDRGQERFHNYIFGFQNFEFEPTLKTGQDFYDMYCEMDLPFSTRFTRNFENLANPYTIESDSVYNFYNAQYEDLMDSNSGTGAGSSGVLLTERTLPSFYNLSTFLKLNPAVSLQQSLYRYSTIGILKDQINTIIKFNDSLNLEEINYSQLINNIPVPKIKLERDYVDTYSLGYQQISRDNLSLIDQKQSNIVIINGRDSLVDSKESQNNNLRTEVSHSPMYNFVKFENNNYNRNIFSFSDNTFADNLIDNEHDLSLIKEVIQDHSFTSDRMRGKINIDDGLETYDLMHRDIFSEKSFRRVIKGEQFGQDLNNNNLSTYSPLGNLKTWDLGNWMLLYGQYNNNIFDKIDDSVISYLGFRKGIKSYFLDRGSEGYQPFSFNEALPAYFNLRLKDSIYSLVEQKARTFSEVLNGNPAHSETVFYRVEKMDIEENKIQDFYFLASSEISVFEWVDDQVKYGKEYLYKIHAYQLVIGTKYRYELRDGYDRQTYLGQLDARLDFKVVYQPCLKLIEIPFHTFFATALDDPPPKPIITPYPYHNVSNKISFHMEGGSGVQHEQPVYIFPEEAELFNKLRRAQGVGEEDPIRFSSEERIEFFEVFRLEHTPRTYNDFNRGYKGRVQNKLVSSNFEHICNMNVTSIGFTDMTIRANTRYYYMFRSVDIHGHTSNPSSILEIELIDTNGLVTPVIRTFEFPHEEPVYNNEFRRYLYISPSLNQVSLSESTIEEITNTQERIDSRGFDQTNIQNELLRTVPSLGSQEESVWDQKFKIRMTSKTTGKKVDINVKFSHEHSEIIENGPCADGNAPSEISTIAEEFGNPLFLGLRSPLTRSSPTLPDITFLDPEE